MLKLNISIPLLVSFTLFYGTASAQKVTKNPPKNDTAIEVFQEYESFDVPRNFNGKYKIALDKVRKVYPLALYAAEIIDSLDNELLGIKKKRKQRKTTRNTHQELKGDFKYLIRDLYISEGQILTKLIYRETGMTVREIIEKYKSGFSAVVYSNMAKLFEQDLDVVYKPNTDDFVIECVVQDILSGKVDFDSNFEKMDRADFKQLKKEEKESRKQYRKRAKKIKKESKNKSPKTQTAIKE